jgi:hypothetical protein
MLSRRWVLVAGFGIASERVEGHCEAKQIRLDPPTRLAATRFRPMHADRQSAIVCVSGTDLGADSQGVCSGTVTKNGRRSPSRHTTG